jgi:hypothetical protein
MFYEKNPGIPPGLFSIFAAGSGTPGEALR